MRLKGPTLVVIGALVGLVIVYATDQVVPASSAYQAQVRVWLAARASGIVTLLLLTLQVVLGLVLSHPTNQTTWRLSRRIFPWHENIWVFLMAFLAAHVVSIVLDPYAGVGLGGALVPGLSAYRSAPVALGVLSLYALIVTGLTARYTTLLPQGWWLMVHRLAVVILVLAWLHGVLAGTDSGALEPLYAGVALAVILAAAYRYAVVRRSVARAAPAGPAAPVGAAAAQPGRAGEPALQPTTASTRPIPLQPGGTDR